MHASDKGSWQSKMADALFHLLDSKRTGSCKKQRISEGRGKGPTIEISIHARIASGIEIRVIVYETSCHIMFGQYEIPIERQASATDDELIEQTILLMSELVSSRVRLHRQHKFWLFDCYTIEVDPGNGWRRIYSGSRPSLRARTETVVLDNWF